MKDYKIVENYNLFKELEADLLGINYRAGKINDKGNIAEHVIFTKVNSFLYKNDDVWKRIELLLNGVKKSKISNLNSPDLIIKKKEKIIIYPYLKGVCVDKILKDSDEKNVPINFDLILSIVLGIADLLESASSIAVSGKRSFHGFLTPDNIIIDYDGNISIKNYGIYAYLNGTDEIYKEIEVKYGTWVTPEFSRKEKPLAQSDIYHLGYMVYKLVTGRYFSYEEGEDFSSKLSDISFLHHIPATDKGFLDNITVFFKKTLNPDPQKRFANIKEFKEFVSNFFNIEELSSGTFNIAYFMNSLYSKEIENTEKEIIEELKYTTPSKIKESDIDDTGTDIVENLLSGLDDHKKSGNKNKYVLIGIVLIAIIIAIFVITSMNSEKGKVEKANIQVQKEQVEKAELKRRVEKDKKEKEELIKKLNEANKKAEEAKQVSLDLEKKIKDEKDAEKLKQLRIEQAKQQKIIKDEKKKKDAAEAEEKRIKKEQLIEDERKEKEAKEKEDARLKEEIRKKNLKVGDMIDDVDKKPVEVNTIIPELSKKLKKKIKGKSVQAIVSVIVNEKGEVSKIKFIKKTGIPEIEMALSRVINLWKFEPAIKYGKKVSTWFTKILIIKK